MIISIHGSKQDNNDSHIVTALIGSLSAVKLNRKTLVVQLFDKSKGIDVLDALIGQEVASTTLFDIDYEFKDTGIDALIRRASNRKLTKEHFDVCSEHLLQSENLLDICELSTKEDFENTLEVSELEHVVNQALNIYDNIFICYDEKNERIQSSLVTYVDINICVAKQSRIANEFTSNDKEIIVIPHFCNNSIYGKRYSTKLYKSKVFYIPENLSAYDNVLGSELLKFILKERNAGKDTPNFYFINSLEKIINAIFEHKCESEANETEPNIKTIEPTETTITSPAWLSTISKESIIVQETKTKPSFFRKTKTMKKVSVCENLSEKVSAKELISCEDGENSEESENVTNSDVSTDKPEVEEDDDKINKIVYLNEPKDIKSKIIAICENEINNSQNNIISIQPHETLIPTETENKNNPFTCLVCGKTNETGNFCNECGSKRTEDIKSLFCDTCIHRN